MNKGKVVLCPNPHRDVGLKCTTDAVSLLEKAGFECVVHPISWVDESNADDTFDHECEGAVLIVSLGGDGTILHTARKILGKKIPILGINLGNVGFLTEIGPDDLQRLITAAEGTYVPSLRMLLSISVERRGKEIYRGSALNDAVIKGTSFAMDLVVNSDGRKMLDYKGDGVILSTPTGSTAYSLSAGGPIVEPTAENIIVTPVCAHVLAARSFVLAPDRAVEVVIKSGGAKHGYISVDGVDTFELEQGDVIRAEKAADQLLIAHVGNKRFFDIVYDKLGETK